MRQLLLVLGLAAVVVGCASDALVPREQTVAIKNRDRALAPHSAAIQATIRQSGNVGALAFLDAGDGHLVVLPGNTPTEAWARHIAPPSDSPTGPVSVPPVVTFVHRADVPKAPESVTYSFLQHQLLQQQETLRTTLAALDTELRKLSDSVVAIRQETRTSIATAREDTQKALDSLAEDLAAARKFMLQTAELGRLDHEMNVENAKGIQKLAAASQEVSSEFCQPRRHHAPAIGESRQSARRACGPARCDTEQDHRRQMRRTMHHGGTGGRCLVILMPFLLLSIAAPAALAIELDRIRESYDAKLRAHQKRITEIEAKGRGASADPGKRADGITRDRIAEIRATLKGDGGAAKRLAELAEKASRDGKALVDVYRGQSEYLDVVTREWGADGAERKKLREAITAMQKSLALVNTDLGMVTEAAAAMQIAVPQSGVLEKVARIEAGGNETRERLSARWERERAVREREREQREREAGERARGLR